jgi:hypothetical protein
MPALDARAAGFFQVLDELSVVFAIEIVAGRASISLAQSLGIVLGYRWTNMTFRKVRKIGGSDASRFRKATTSM